MCGIAGFDWYDKNLIRRMTKTLSHRGPDDSGIHATESISLGHTRLSIIDLSKLGHQPMYNESKDLVIVYNGEIWNYVKLRKKLIEKGHKFKSNTDTEVVLRGYEEYKEGIFKLLDGMFALAIWDSKAKKLILARDKSGKKPIYYFFDKKKFVFASEIKAIIEDSKIKREINLECLADYLSLRHSPNQMTMFKNIKKLAPGSFLVLKNSKIVTTKYYELPNFSPKHNYSIKEIDNLIASSIKKRLMSDVPIGVFLSGGLDSSTIVAYMSRFTKNIKTFSVGFGGVTDETEHAKIVADQFKTDHTTIKLDKNVLQTVPAVVWSFDEPLADPAAIPTYLLCEEVSKKVKVAISGEGGDEIFGGYQTFNYIKDFERFMNVPFFLRKKLFSPILSTSSHLFKYPKKQILKLASEISSENNMRRAYKKLFYFPFSNEEIEKILLKKDFERPLKSRFDEIFEKHKDIREAVQIYYFQEWLPNDLLMKADKMSMASGLEVRTPFLDNELIKYFLSLEYKHRQNRRVFRETIKNVLKKETLKKKKQGFTLPLTEWFVEKEVLQKIKPHIKDLGKRNIFDGEQLNKIIENPRDFKNDHKLWVLLNFEIWCKIYLDKIDFRKIKI